MLRVLLFLAIAAIVFQNCGDDANFSKSSSEAEVLINGQLDGDQTSDIGVINENCDTLTPQTKTINVKFPKPTKTCEWGKNGNLDERDAYFRARIEQKVGLGLPVGAVICDAQFDFDPQPYQYDDYFALLFNNSVITSGYDFRDELTPKNFGLLQYDWPLIRGIEMNFGSNKERIYCPQIPGATANCNFPGHDTPGSITLAYDKDYIRAVMSNGVPANHTFTLVTFGDNNEFDCEHSDVEFDVTVEYVVTQ